MLKLSDIRKEPSFRIGSADIAEIRDLISGKYGLRIDFDVFLPSKGKNLQRDLVWSVLQKQELILSILKGIKIPEFAIIQYKNSVNDEVLLKIIDGKQRLTTILDFANGKFPIWFNDIPYFFNDLDEKGQRAILFFSIKGKCAYEYDDEPISDDDKIAWFELINFSGTPQDRAHLNNLKS